jgi:acid phosphatase
MTSSFTSVLVLSFVASVMLFADGKSLFAQLSMLERYEQGASILLKNLQTVTQPKAALSLELGKSSRSPTGHRSEAVQRFGSANRSSADDEVIRPRLDDAVSLGAGESNSDTAAHEDLDALLWLRTSPEFDALTRQTFASATNKLGKAILDSGWNAQASAEREQPDADLVKLPPCVIVDVDETVLDNSLYQLELIRDDGQYDPVPWNKFVQREVSTALDGAVDFLQSCRKAEVSVFFVTNRDASVEASTRKNLIAQRLMEVSDPDLILSRNEFPDWTADKTSRRRAVARKYRILLLLGDDLNDFVSAKNLSMDQRQRLYRDHQEKWGRFWFMLPNPNYGGWEQATYQYQHQQTISQKRRSKRATLMKSAESK